MCEHGFLKVRNWETFQHYKNRNPPWIKLATDTFQNYDFGRLQDASKLLAICIWTLAARSEVGESGSIPNDLDWIKSQCGLGTEITKKNMQELINKGFMSLDSNALADCKQNACLEGEGEGEKRESREEGDSPPAGKKSRKKEPTDLSPIIDLWNKSLVPHGILPLEESMTKTNTQQLEVLMRKSGWFTELPELIEAIKASEYHMGKNEHGFMVHASWLVKTDKTDALLTKHRTRGKVLSMQQPSGSPDARARHAHDEQLEMLRAKLEGRSA